MKNIAFFYSRYGSSWLVAARRGPSRPGRAQDGPVRPSTPPKHAQTRHINRAPLHGTPDTPASHLTKSALKVTQVTSRCDAATISLGPAKSPQSSPFPGNTATLASRDCLELFGFPHQRAPRPPTRLPQTEETPDQPAPPHPLFIHPAHDFSPIWDYLNAPPCCIVRTLFNSKAPVNSSPELFVKGLR
ncbi:hypothetical protein CCANI_03530 [Corynebacterium canis]|nr:hypothetical protein CCANI_03530 [Corynebacterium canis]